MFDTNVLVDAFKEPRSRASRSLRHVREAARFVTPLVLWEFLVTRGGLGEAEIVARRRWLMDSSIRNVPSHPDGYLRTFEHLLDGVRQRAGCSPVDASLVAFSVASGAGVRYALATRDGDDLGWAPGVLLVADFLD